MGKRNLAEDIDVFGETPPDSPDDDGEGDEGDDAELRDFLNAIGMGYPEGTEHSDENEVRHAQNKFKLGVMLRNEQKPEWNNPASLRYDIEELRATLESFAATLQEKGIATKEELRQAQIKSLHETGNGLVNAGFAGSGMSVTEIDD